MEETDLLLSHTFISFQNITEGTLTVTRAIHIDALSMLQTLGSLHSPISSAQEEKNCRLIGYFFKHKGKL